VVPQCRAGLIINEGSEVRHEKQVLRFAQDETEYGADVGEDWPVARINAERYLALLAVVALGGWRISRYMRGIGTQMRRSELEKFEKVKSQRESLKSDFI
jgi:hypothetical protein